MADVNANIGVGIDTSDALAQLKNLQRQISNFHSSIAKSSATAAASQRNLQKNFLNSINAIEGFSAELRTVKTTSEAFSTSLEKNKFSMREYFRYAAGATKTFGKSFKSEFDTIEKTAVERVKSLQTQYIKLGRDANGAMQAIKIRPNILDMENLGTQTAIAAQKQALFNQLVKQGSTQLLNFGKNTQWAGRQLMVGFTLPLATLGITAGRTFMEMEKAVLKFRKVYGDLFTTQADVEEALQGIKDLAMGYTQYGIAVSETIGLAADAAAAGYQGVDLQNQTAAATRLSVLGQIEANQALETTISLQNAFNISSGKLAETIDFLNAVENQTVVSLDDITTAIPKVAPIIQQLGGDVKDLSFFMAAFEEGGINASEGANALKSGLAALINPTTKASEMLGSMGINIRGIVEANTGDLAGTIVSFSKALDTLAPTDRARAIEQLFGKFQFARMSTLFQNVSKDGTQAARVLELAGSSISDLAALSEKELGQTAESTMNKFTGAVERLNAALAPVGEQFMKIATPIIEFATKVLDGFNKLPDGVKTAIATTIGVVGGLAPIFIMVFGLLANGLANAIKFFAIMRQGFLKITGQAAGAAEATQYMTTEQLEASAAAASLNQAHSNLTQQFTAETSAVMQLKSAYEQAMAAGNRFALMNPGQMKGGFKAKGFASGGVVGGSGNGDTIPAMLTPGEFVVNQKAAQAMLPFLQALNSGKLAGFSEGGEAKKYMYGGASVNLSGLGLPGVPGNSGGATYGMSKQFFREGPGFGDSMMAAGIAGGATLDGARLDEKNTRAYQDALSSDIPKIIETLRKTERDMLANGENITSIESITEKARTELEVIFADMTKRGGKSASAAKALKEHAFFPTEEAMTGPLRETRVGAVKGLPGGPLTSTTLRTKTSPLQRKAVAVHKRITGGTSTSGGSYAHLNEQRLGGDSVPLAGGAMGLPDAERARFEAGVATESAKIASKYPKGKQSTRTIKDAKEAGVKTTQAFQDGSESVKLEDPYMASRDRNSPHKQAAKDGKDDAVAYEEAKSAELKTVPAQATQAAAITGKSFGPGSKVPIPAAGNAPRQVVAQVAAAPRTLAGDVKASMANFKPNIAAMGAEMKAEWAAIADQIKNLFKRKGQETVAAVDATNNQLIVNGKKAGFDYVAQYQGRDGAIAAVLTKGQAEIVSKATAAWNAGARDIPRIISDGVKANKPLLDTSGMFIADQIAKSSLERSKALAATMPPVVSGPASKAPMDISGGVTKAMSKIEAFGSKAMGAGFALSSISGVLSMFGGELGQAASVIFTVTSLMTALSAVTNMLVTAKTKELVLAAAGRAQVAANRIADAGGMMVGKGGATGIKAVGQNIGRLFTAALGGPIGKVAGMFLKFVPFLGIALTAFAAFQFLAKVIQEQKEKITGLGDTAFLTADKMKKAGELLNFQAKSLSLSGQVGGPSGVDTKQLSSAQDLRATEDFTSEEKGFGKEIKAIKESSLAEAQSALNSMMMQLIAAGSSPEAAQALATAIATEAGKTEVDLSFAMKIDPNDAESFKSIDLATNAAKTKIDNAFANYTPKIQYGGHGGNAVDAGLTDEMKKTAASVAGEIASAYSLLKSGLDSGVVDASQFNAQLNLMLTNLDNMDAAALQTMIPTLMDKLDPDGKLKGLGNIEDKLLAIKALMAGVTIPDKDVKALEKAGKPGASKADLAAGAKARANINKLIGEETTKRVANAKAVEKENAVKVAAQQYTDAMNSMQEQIDKLNAEITAYDTLTKSGVGTAEAIKMVSDANFIAAYAAATNATEQQAVIDKWREIQKLAKKSPVTTGGGGGGAEKADPYKDGIKSLREQRAEMTNTKLAFEKLSKTEKDAGKALEIASNPQLLALMAEGVKVGSKKWKDMVYNIKAVETAMLKLEKIKVFQEGMTALRGQKKDLNTTVDAYKELVKAGYDTNQALKMSESPELLAAMQAGIKAGSKEWLAMVAAIKEVEAAQEALRQSSPQGMTDQFNEVYDKVSAIFAAGEAQLDAAYEKKTSADKKLITQLEEQIESKNDLMEGYNKQLEGIAEKEEAINKAYDEKAKKLEEVKKVNQAILNQQKSQQSIAEALSKGDISAAATAIQESRANNAQAALDSQSGAMDAAKAAQLGAVTSANGLTRVELEGKIKTIQNEIYTIQTGTLRAAQDRVKAADAQLVSDKAALTVAGLTKTAWADKKIAIDLAESSAKLYEKDTLLALGNVSNIVAEWKKVPATVKTNIVVTYTTVGNPPAGLTGVPSTTTKLGTAAQGALKYPGLSSTVLKGMGYYADGGFVARGTDTVPAMLTPGEFVVNSASTRRFAPLLEAMNTGSFRYSVPPSTVVPTDFNKSVYNVPARNYSPADPTVVFPRTGSEVIEQSDNSVYNYNLSISIDGNGLNADEIANRVMSKIKRVDSQRLRNQGIR